MDNNLASGGRGGINTYIHAGKKSTLQLLCFVGGKLEKKSGKSGALQGLISKEQKRMLQRVWTMFSSYDFFLRENKITDFCLAPLRGYANWHRRLFVLFSSLFRKRPLSVPDIDRKKTSRGKTEALFLFLRTKLCLWT